MSGQLDCHSGKPRSFSPGCGPRSLLVMYIFLPSWARGDVYPVSLPQVFLTEMFICISMEYATGGSLFHYVQKQGKLKEAVARWFFQQLVIGVDYCHKKGVANRWV